MITWQEYLIMQFLNTVTFLIIQEFFWLKMRNKFDTIIGHGRGVMTKTPFQKIRQHMKDWKEKEKEAILQGYRK